MPSRRRRQEKELPRDFDFFRYEVWFGVAVGSFVTCVLVVTLPVFIIVLLLSTLGVSWGVTHLIGRWMVRGRRDRQLQKEEEDERERRALAAREAASIENESHSRRRRQRR